jgi:hypothetical protein
VAMLSCWLFDYKSIKILTVANYNISLAEFQGILVNLFGTMPYYGELKIGKNK